MRTAYSPDRQPPTLDLSGKTALVTGATGELGRIIARTLARCGADVALHYHHNDTAVRVASLQGEIVLAGSEGDSETLPPFGVRITRLGQGKP